MTAEPTKPRDATTMELGPDREIIISRVFRAPPSLVFDAWTQAELVRRWWAPVSRGVELTSCTADVREGGIYRYVLRHGAHELAFSGVYREVTRPRRLVYTQVFEPMAEGGAAVITVSFESTSIDGREATKLVSHEVYPSREARDMALSSGMEDGMRETMDLLFDLVVELARGGR